MPDMSPKKYPMPIQDADIRKHNFEEVELGYTEDTAIKEAQRCLGCKNAPCIKGCPVNIDIPSFISSIKDGDAMKAYNTITKTSSLPAICGRVCPQEEQCEKHCVRGIKSEPVAIGRLERFAADFNYSNKTNEVRQEILVNDKNKKVAIIGAGPAGLSCAATIGAAGYSVTIFESLHIAGGVLTYGIPEFRLPKKIVEAEIKALEKLGVEIKTNTVIGKLKSLDELFENGFSAVFIASGAGLPNYMNIPGEMLLGVYSANEILTRINLMKAYLPNSQTPINKMKHVAVIGGGNVAMDAARSALRVGAEEVMIVYRRSMDELPARKEEVEHAIQEGVKFVMLTNPVSVIDDSNGAAKYLRCVKMELGEPDDSGRRRPIEIKNSEFDIEIDTVIMAIGTSPNPLIKDTTSDLAVNNRGCFVVDAGMKTSKNAVWAGGDAVTGAATVISAMGAGKMAANEIIEYLKN